VALAFARDRGGQLVPVGALDAASRRARAPFTCPGCGDELVARLGARRARHFAHRPGSTCPLTAPETALHFNAKARLLTLCAEAFAGARRVTLRIRCGACRRPEALDLGVLGDAARDEEAVGGRRADVLVTRRGAPALAFEVLVTHAVDEAKAAALGAAGVPAVEIDARVEWEREGPGGVIEVAGSRALGFPPCRACRAETLAEADRALGGEAAQVAELESYRARGLLRLDAASGGHDAVGAGHDAKAGSRRRVKSPPRHGFSGPDPEYFDHDSGSAGDYSGSGNGSEGSRRAFSAAERDGLTRRFRCPDCRGTTLLMGSRLATHPCPVHGSRPVAWRGYDGRLAELGWWKR
jgi:ribosomal protein S27E